MPRAKKLNLDQLLIKIVELLVRHSPSTLSFSKVSRLTGVPRSTLYYYFGSSKEKMVAEAVRFGMRAFVQLTALDKGDKGGAKTWKEFQVMRFKSSAQILKDYPWSTGLYFRYRNDQSALGENIREVEAKYLQRLTETWKSFHDGKAPDELSARLASYLKLGLFWGLGVDHDKWFDEKNAAKLEKMIEKIVEITDLATEMTFS